MHAWIDEWMDGLMNGGVISDYEVEESIWFVGQIFNNVWLHKKFN